MVAGDVYQQLPYDEIVGVSRSRRKNGFILHSYPLKNPNQVPHSLLHLTPSPVVTTNDPIAVTTTIGARAQ
jgi:hypothetical protein